MTAEQTVGLTERQVHVVPSRSIQAGLGAAVAYDKRTSGEANAREMTAAIERAISGEVTRAVRKSQVDGVKVKAGDFIGLVEDRVVVASQDLDAVLEAVLARLLRGDREMLTARQHYPKVEVDVQEGGQPYYPVLLVAE
jgi:dihydroxyacetone kinase-like predicted kinase